LPNFEAPEVKMKRLYVYMSVSIWMMALLSFAAISWAGEASYFDNTDDAIVRAYTTGSGPYTVYIGAYDTTLATKSNIKFKCGQGNPANPAEVGGASNPDISMAFDTEEGTAYVVYTTQQGAQIAACIISISDTEPPTVSITAPSSGATVSGTVTLSASASDNVGVVGVQFKVDNNNVGNEDLTPPYSVSWDSTTVANGSHTITAVARDAAGNTGTSTGVVVTVSNGGGTCSGPDLRITSFSQQGCCANNTPFSISLTIKNIGNSDAGAFKVKGYWSADKVPGNTGDKLLYTWDVSGLAAGQSLSNTFTNLTFSGYPIHTSYYIINVVDSDGQVTECNEDNNIFMYYWWLSRVE